MELSLKNDPNLYLHDEGSHLHVVQFAYSDVVPGRKCGDMSSQGVIRYDVFQYFMNERDLSADHYYDVIEKMMQVNYIQENAIQVSLAVIHPITFFPEAGELPSDSPPEISPR